MSAIAGIFHLDSRPVEQRELHWMLQVMEDRGPDGGATWRGGSVGMGHAMLATTPEAVFERLPLADEAADLVLVMDGRIDNRTELQSTLRLPERGKRLYTDGDLVLAAYRRWGRACAHRVLGAFSFAIWDGAHQHIFCATDHAAIRPVYYYHAPGRVFVFGSAVRALLQIDGVPAELNETKVAEHLLVPLPGDASRCYFRNIYRLPPGHSLTVGRDRLTLECYWKPEPAHTLHLASTDEYAEAFRELFSEAVRCRLRSTSPVGAMLSGGLDSSSITCVAASLLAGGDDRRLHTFSAVFDGVPASDERMYIDAVHQRADAIPHVFHGDCVGPLSRYDQILVHTDGANPAGNLYLNWHLYEMAREQGVGVILDGFDGDSTVSHGLGYLSELRATRRWVKLAREVRAFAIRNGEPWPAAVWSWFRQPLISRSGLLDLRKRLSGSHRRSTEGRPRSEPAWKEGLNAEFLERISAVAGVALPPLRSEREEHYRRLTAPVLSDTLALLHAISAPFNIEIRFPFFDRRLMEFCLSLPPEQKLSRGWSRFVLRQAMSGILPEEVRRRGGKTSLTAAFRHGLSTHDREHIDKMIRHDTGNISRFVSQAGLDALYRRYTSQTIDDKEELLLWRALSLALWLEHSTNQSNTRLPTLRKQGVSAA